MTVITFFSALESQLINQFCEDENGAVFYNHILNGHRNGNNGHGYGVVENHGHVEDTKVYQGHGNNGYVNGNDGGKFTVNHEENQIQRRPNSRGRGDSFALPISADPLRIQVFNIGYTCGIFVVVSPVRGNW